MVDKFVAALILNDIGTLLELNGADPFRAKAFYTAARALERADDDLPELLRSDRLRALPGIGPTTARVVEELAETGGSVLHTELRERTATETTQLRDTTERETTQLRETTERMRTSGPLLYLTLKKCILNIIPSCGRINGCREDLDGGRGRGIPGDRPFDRAWETEILRHAG